MKLLSALALLLALGACSSTQDTQSIGSGTDAYKRSPCACGPVVLPKNQHAA